MMATFMFGTLLQAHGEMLVRLLVLRDHRVYKEFKESLDLTVLKAFRDFREKRGHRVQWDLKAFKVLMGHKD
jgi:hypothetical protein